MSKKPDTEKDIIVFTLKQKGLTFREIAKLTDSHTSLVFRRYHRHKKLSTEEDSK